MSNTISDFLENQNEDNINPIAHIQASGFLKDQIKHLIKKIDTLEDELDEKNLEINKLRSERDSAIDENLTLTHQIKYLENGTSK